MATCVAEWSTSSAGWTAVAAAGTVIQSAVDMKGGEREAERAQTDDSDIQSDRNVEDEITASLSLLLPRVLVASRAHVAAKRSLTPTPPSQRVLLWTQHLRNVLCRRCRRLMEQQLCLMLG